MRALLAAVVLLATLFARGTAQLSFGPIFSISDPTTSEGAQLVVRLSASILTRSFAPAFTGRIEVDIAAEDLPAGDTRLRATLGSDYIVNTNESNSTDFTVTFLSKQANSTEHVIHIADDEIFERREYFRLRLKAIRPIGQAADFYEPQAGFENTFVDINIEDDDIVQVNWTISRAVNVTEGDVVELKGEAFGIYANEIAIGVECSETIATDVEPAFPGRDFNFTVGTKLHFTSPFTVRSISSDEVVIPIINDDIAEPRESFICTLQGGIVDSVQTVFPSQVTIEIRDDDELIVRWAKDFYEFGENELATVELVTESNFEVASIAISGRPGRIPDNDPISRPSLQVCGPQLFRDMISFFPIEQASFRVRSFGKAQVTLSGRTDVESTSNDFIFTPASKSAFDSFNIIDDSVLEFNELLMATFDFGPEITNNWNVRKGDPSTTYISILDNDFVEVCFQELGYNVTEGTGQVSVSLRITGQFFVPLHAFIEVSDGTATDPEDYSGAGIYRVDFCQTAFTDTDTPAPFADSLPIIINITNDIILEGMEYFQVHIVNTSDFIRVRTCARDTVNVTIIDDDNVTVCYENETYSVEEEAGVVTLALVLKGETTIPVTVNVTTLDLLNSSVGDAATAVLDYLPRTPFDVTFPVGSKRQLYNVTIERNDSILENSEYFNADVNARPEDASRVLIGSPKQPLIEILDNDTVTVHYEDDLYSVEEEAGFVTLVLVLEGDAAIPVTVSASTLDLLNSSVGDAATALLDYLPRTPFDITFPVGNKRQLYNVTIVDDIFPENSEYFNADVNARPEDASRVLIGSPEQPLCEIQDNVDQEVEIFLDQTAYSIFENEINVTVTLRLSDVYRQDIAVSVTVGELAGIDALFRAQADVDFSTAGFPQVVTIRSGQTSVQFTVTVIDELIVERDEQFQLSFTYSGSQPGVIVRPGFDQANITIRNDDDLRVMLEQDLYTVREDIGSLTYGIVATSTASFDYQVMITAMDGSAICGLDYHESDNMTCSYSVIVDIPAGQSNGSAMVAIIDDDIYEAQEDFFLDLSIAPEFQALRILEGTILRATVQIEDDEELSVFFRPANYSVLEGGDRELTLVADKRFEVSFTVDVALEDITAIAPDDYVDRDYRVVFDVATQRGTLIVMTESDSILEDDELFMAVLSVPAGVPRVSEGSPSEAIVTIVDQTAAQVFFDPDLYPVLEGQVANLTLKLTVDVDPSVTIIVMVQTMDGTATDGADYTGGLLTATFSGSSTAVVQVPTLKDDDVEGAENFTAVIQVPAETTQDYRVTAGSPDTATVLINDDDMLMVFFERPVYMVREDDLVAMVTVLASEPHALPFTITVVATDGSAIEGDDYTGTTFSVTFPSGAQSATFEIPIIDDMIFEGPEEFGLRIIIPQEAADIGVQPGMPIESLVRILDDEVIAVYFDPSQYRVMEGGSVAITLKVNGTFSVAFNVNVTLMDITAIAPGDYDASSSPYTVSFVPGQMTASIIVDTVNDSTIELTEQFKATLTIPAASSSIGVIKGSPDVALVDILDDDGPLIVTLPGNYSVIEGQSAQVLVMLSTSDYEFDFNVTLMTMDGSAVAPGDYDSGPYTVTFTAGQASAIVMVPTIDDTTSELTEYFSIMATSTTQADKVEIGSPDTSHITIGDNEPVIAVSVMPQNYTVTEGDKVNITLVLNSSDYEFGFTVTLEHMDGSAVAPGDYDSGPYTVTFTAGQDSAIVMVQTVDDSTLELTEYFKVMITSTDRPGKVQPGDPDTSYITILDNEPDLILTLPANDTVTEGQPGEVVVMLSSIDYEFDFTVTLMTMDGSAVAPGDYDSGPYTVTFTAGQASAILMVPTIDDSTSELTEYFTVMATSTTQADVVEIGSPDTSHITIEDNEPVITVSVMPQNYTVTEGGKANITLVLNSSDYEFGFTVTLEHMDGSAVAPGDYDSGPYTVTFTAGQDSAIVMVQTMDDSTLELNEYFKVMITSTDRPDKVQPGDPDTSYITILDNEPALIVTLPANDTVTEGQPGEVVVMLSTSDYEFDFTVTLMTMDGSAVAPGDYDSGPYTVNFTAGQVSAILMVPTIDDSTSELTEYFTVMATSTTQADVVEIGSPDTSHITIEDNEPVITVSVMPQNYTVTEGDKVNITLVLNSSDYEFGFTVTLEHMDGSAVAPGDYDSGPYTVTFTAGQDSAIVMVPTVGDSTLELTEYFKVMITSTDRPDKIQPGDPDTSYITILDNEPALIVTLPANDTVTEGQPGEVVVMLSSSDYAFDFTVTLMNMDGSAEAPGDYDGGPYTVMFIAGQASAILMVPTNDDNITEMTEYFKVMIVSTSMPSLVQPGDPDTSYITINDNEPNLTVFFDPASYNVIEGANATVSLMASTSLYSFPFSVSLSYMDNTAEEGDDYMSVVFTVSFSAGQKTATFVVPTIDDNIAELTENFKIVIVSTSNSRAVPGAPDTASVDIIDNDALTVMFQPADYETPEGDTEELILVTNRPYSFSFTINVTTQDGSAVSPADYNGGSYIASFTPSLTTAGSSSVMVSTEPDNILEGLEYFTAVLSVPAGFPNVQEGVPSLAQVNITDTTIAGVFFDPDVYMVPEGDNVTLTLRTNVTVNKRFRVIVNTVDDSANSPSDYQGGERIAIFEIGSSTATVQYSTAEDGTREGVETFTAELTVPLDMQAMGIFAGTPDTAVVNIVDGEDLFCMLVSTMYVVSEDVGDLEVMVMCSVPSEDPFTLLVRSTDGTAMEGEDYTGREFFVMFPANSTKESFTIPIINDDVYELDEMFSLTLEIPQPAQDAGVMRGVPFMATVTITNDDPRVTIDLEQRVIDVIENQKQVEVCLVKNGTSSRPIMALVSAEEIMGGAGSPGLMGASDEEDFESDLNVSSIVIMGSETKKCTNVTIIDDETVEMMEPFEVIIIFPAGQESVDIGEIVPAAMQLNGTINIIDDDEITVQFVQDMYMVRESDGMVDIIVGASGKTSFSYMFTVTPMDITAMNSVDYVFTSTIYEFLSADDNDPTPSTVISIPIIPDDINEFDETFKLTIVVSDEARASNVTEGEISMTVVLIKDDDNVTVSFSPQNYTVPEGTPAELMIVLDKPSVNNITITVTTMDITAEDGADYTGGSFNVVIPAGTTKVTVPVDTLNDDFKEDDEFFKATLTIPSAPEDVVIGSANMAFVTITDETPDIPVQFNPAEYFVKEGVDSIAVITLEALEDHPGFAFDVTVIARDGTAIRDSDYEGERFTVTFPAGVNMISFNVTIIDDAVAELAELFSFELEIPAASAAMGVIKGSPDTATVNIMDDDVVFISFSPQNYTVPEGTPADIMIVLDKPSPKDINITVTTMDITAEDPDDYTGGSFTVLIPAGTVKVTVSVATLNDNFVEDDEYFKATLSLPGSPEAVEVGSPDMAFVTITDETPDIPVQFNPAVYSVKEGEDSNAVITLEALEDHPDFAFTVTVVTQNGTAIRGSDYEGERFTVTFPAGVNVISFNVTIINDNIAELTEFFTLDLEIPAASAAMGVIKGSSDTATVNIMDDEVVVISFSPQNYTVPEGTPADIMIVLDKPSPKDINITVTTMDITAEDPDDYTGGSFTVLIPAGTVKVTVSVATLNDNFVEDDEYFKATLSLPGSPEAVEVGSPDMAFVTITDETPDIPVQFNPAVYSVKEGEDSNAVITLEALEDHPDFAFTVTVVTQNGTAICGSDYEGERFTVTFPAGVNVISFNVTIIDDNVAELAEFFTLDLEIPAASAAMGVIKGSPDTATVNIMDDEVVVISFNPQNYTVPEGTPADIMIVLDKPSPKDINITVTTMDITAEDPDDYTGGSFTVLIPAGTVKVTVSVTTLTDSLVEDDEYFKATLSLPGSPEAVEVGSPDMSFVTITDETLFIPVRFNPANYTVKEGVDSNAVITLEALGAHPEFGFAVTVVTQDGSAIRGSDYEGASFTVFFPAGVNVISFNVTIIDDVIAECAELFTLALEIPEISADMGVVKDSPDTATVNIMDDDVEELMISLDSADYLVKEDAGSFMAVVTATREADFPYTVTVDSADGTALVGDDYQSVMQLQLEFAAGETRKEFNVTIVDDNVIEDMESFQLSLSITDDIISKGVQLGPNATATVTIMDNDVEVKFSREVVSVTEDDGQAPVTVVAMGDLSSGFSIIVMAINGTAYENSDFTGNMWRVIFPALATERGFSIPIIRDSIPEDTEEFSLKIVIESPLDERVSVGEPSILRVQITDLDNDTVRGDPLFSIPLPSKYLTDPDLKSVQLCFEVHGVSGNHYNLISDSCTSVSARYSEGVVDSEMNVITEMGVKSQGSNGTCHTIEVDLNQCSAYVDGVFRNTTSTIFVNGISITIRRKRVRVSLPNCDTNKRLTLWMLCTKRNREDMMELVVARGDGLKPTAHGLIGQFWNIPLTIEPYVGPYGDGSVVESDKKYTVTTSYPGAQNRTFVADYGKRDWLDNRHCLYAGNRNAGPIGEVKGDDSVIEGKAGDYVVAGLFSTDFTFSKYNGNC